jgi:hypothetical protein
MLFVLAISHLKREATKNEILTEISMFLSKGLYVHVIDGRDQA